MKISREEIGGVVGTGIFAVLLLLILIFSYFTLMPVPDELEGVPVMFGNVENSFGDIEPPMNEIIPEPQAQEPKVPVPSPAPPLITQDIEPTINVTAKREEERKKAQQVAEQQRLAQQRVEEQRIKEEQIRLAEIVKKKREEDEKRKRDINQQMSGLFGESSGSRGDTEGTGTQGVSTGNDSKGSTSGLGGVGTYNLGGRSLGQGGLVRPGYTVNDEGIVVVTITVDPQGNVINTEIGKGTTTPNSTLRKAALDAAKRTKFNSITSMNNQQGTITYRFNLN